MKPQKTHKTKTIEKHLADVIDKKYNPVTMRPETRELQGKVWDPTIMPMYNNKNRRIVF